MATIDSVKLPDNSTYDLTDNYSGYQTETLATPITVDGTSETTVEGALGAVNNYAEKIKDNLTGRNLFDNGWFTVNQRGWTSGAAVYQDYCVSAWQMTYQHVQGTVEALAGGGVRITSGNDAGTGVYQLRDYSYLNGKTITFSVLFEEDNSGTRKIETYTINNFDSSTNTALISTSWILVNYITTFGFLVRAQGNKTVSFYAVKLETGSISTLANDVAPDYALELAKCQTSTADPSDTYANQGQLMTSALQGVLGAKNICDLEGYLNKCNVAFTKSGNAYSFSMNSTFYTSIFTLLSHDTPLTVTATSITGDCYISLIDENGTPIGEIAPGSSINVTQTFSKIKFAPALDIVPVTITGLMIRDARITDDTFEPFAMTNNQLTEMAQNVNDLAVLFKFAETSLTLNVSNPSGLRQPIVIFGAAQTGRSQLFGMITLNTDGTINTANGNFTATISDGVITVNLDNPYALCLILHSKDISVS